MAGGRFNLVQLVRADPVGWYLLLLLGFGFVARMLLIHYGIVFGDFSLWIQWGEHTWSEGFATLYERQPFNDRLPGGIFYLLWLLAAVRHTWPWLSDAFVYKFPANFADILLAYLVYIWVRRVWGAWRGFVAGSLYVFNPFTWYVSSLWGQLDSVQALLMVLMLFLLWRGRYAAAAVVLSYVVMFKPHSVALAPLLLALAWVTSGRWTFFARRISLAGAAAGFFLWLQTVPFLPADRWLSNAPLSIISEPFLLIAERFRVALSAYPFASVNALNVWTALGFNLQPDAVLFIGLSMHHWGMIMFGLVAVLIFAGLARGSVRGLALCERSVTAAALLVLAAFVFMTRAHERHLYPVFGFLALGLFGSYYRILHYVLLTLLALFNVAAVYRGPLPSEAWHINWLSLGMIWLFVLLLIDFLRGVRPGDSVDAVSSH
ncbi:MAG: hypothetical protein HY372_01955 [Candidatus Andersenbacteria bacterium]|nr:hypothetical protein [Candidatus Andersenbacteria bacterium]